MSKRKRSELSLAEKVEVIKNSEGKSHRQLAEKFGIGRTQVSSILKRKAELMKTVEENGPATMKRVTYKCQYAEVDKLTWEWFTRARSLKMPISGPFIQARAREFAVSLGIQDFKGDYSCPANDIRELLLRLYV